MKNPFASLHILDFTHVYSGPYCTMLFADLGAQVLKIEKPEEGDDSRHYLPFKNGQSGYFMYLNRNKKSMTLNLKSKEGKRIVLYLIKRSDIVVENFSPGTMKKLGLDYKEVKKIRPNIIYASISGFGQSGPLCGKPAFDIVAQAMGGMMSITGFPDRPPVKCGASISDANAGIHAAFAIMAALYNREKTGKGQYIDVAMMDTTVSILENYVMQYTLNGIVPKRNGNEHSASAPFDAYQTKDNYVVIATGSNKLFERLIKVMHCEDLIYDSRFATNILRKKHYAELKPVISSWMGKYSTNDIITWLDKAKVPVAPILSIAELVQHPQLQIRNMMVDVNQPGVGNITMPGFPIHFSEINGSVRTPSPLLGENNEEILKNILHYDEKTVQKLKKEKII
ncbi:CoA transferase [Megasphaera paucivorans]|uniref:CoA:oxalate CoA-transferase n=1 Tax=Megasphaera paucivorans TaxID=349095 RepID=A0A1G9WVM8_9FIRM|nr:CoA transferase [Megasphaera paucivorans]SDM88530.1 CoA:oxalate CoA-transferase [Megasphaera paucivorans]